MALELRRKAERRESGKKIKLGTASLYAPLHKECRERTGIPRQDLPGCGNDGERVGVVEWPEGQRLSAMPEGEGYTKVRT